MPEYSRDDIVAAFHTWRLGPNHQKLEALNAMLQPREKVVHLNDHPYARSPSFILFFKRGLSSSEIWRQASAVVRITGRGIVHVVKRRDNDDLSRQIEAMEDEWFPLPPPPPVETSPSLWERLQSI